MAEPTEAQQQARKLWSSGDYPSAMRVIASVGELVVERAGVSGDDVVLVGLYTCGSRWVQYEIEQSAKRGNGMLGIDISKNTFHVIGLDDKGAIFCVISCRAAKSMHGAPIFHRA